jgi:hypothetical protein
MIEEPEDGALEALLWRELKLDARAPDEDFVCRVDRAVLERQRFERTKATLSRQLLGDLLGLGAVLTCVVLLSLTPPLRDNLAEWSVWGWGGLGSLVLLWSATRRPRSRIG